MCTIAGRQVIVPVEDLDDDLLARVKPNTVDRYRKTVQGFAEWIFAESFAPVNAEDWDDLLLLYKRTHELKKSAFSELVAAVEFVFPRYKGSLTV